MLSDLNRLFDRPDLKPRAMAAVIDISIAVLIIFGFVLIGLFAGGSFAFTGIMFLGSIVAFLFILLKDGLYYSASPGKKIMGLRVVSSSGNFINISQSAARNFLPSLPFLALAMFLLCNLAAPYVGSVILFPAYAGFFVAIGLFCYDLFCMLNDREQGLRWGERTSNTLVTESVD